MPVSHDHPPPLNDVNVWLDFKIRLTALHPQFFSELSLKHPSLTPNEIKLCALILMECDTKAEAVLLVMSTRAILAMRKRLLAKFGLTEDGNIHAYLVGLC